MRFMPRFWMVGLICCAVGQQAGAAEGEGPAGDKAGGDGAAEMAPLNVFAGRVVDHAGEPVGAAAVAVASAENGFISYNGPNRIFKFAPDDKVLMFFTARNGKRSAQVVAGADGRFRIEGLAEGTYNLLAVDAKRGIKVLAEVEQPNADEPIEVKLDPPTFLKGSINGLQHVGRIFGSLSADEARWDSVNVSLRLPSPARFLDADGPPAPQGSFRVGPLPADASWRVTLRKYVSERSFGCTILSLPVEIEAGKENEIQVDLTEGYEIAGLIKGPDDKPLKNVAVEVSVGEEEKVSIYGALTDEDGRYLVRGVPAGTAKLLGRRWAVRTKPG